MKIDQIIYRLAKPEDIAAILNLYYEVYTGSYPDSMFSNFKSLEAAISSRANFIFVATYEYKVIACLLFKYDSNNLLGKAGAAIVASEYRGYNITQKLINHGITYLQKNTVGLELLYATTRTVHKAAQLLTQQMGFKKLGIFPNVHKTHEYETHALTGIYLSNSIDKRYTNFEQHPKVFEIFNIVKNECSLPSMQRAEDWNKKEYNGDVSKLEFISAPSFVGYRFEKQIKGECIDFAFYPFLEPNVLITSPDSRIELFLNINELDKSCAIIGCKIDREVSLTKLFLKVCSMLRDQGVRYIEMIVRANRLNIIEKVIQSKFIPSGYVPALQKTEDNIRFDYVVLSRSFEILDFNNLELTGVNELYLKEYIKAWEEIALGNKFLSKVDTQGDTQGDTNE